MHVLPPRREGLLLCGLERGLWRSGVRVFAPSREGLLLSGQERGLWRSGVRVLPPRREGLLLCGQGSVSVLLGLCSQRLHL